MQNAMRNRDWIHRISPEERERRNALMAQHLDEQIARMEQWTEEQCRKLRMTTRARDAAERAWKKVIARGRRYVALPKHTSVERRFLRMMIKLLIAENPGLVERAVELARYVSADYPFEWCISPCTALARVEARNVLLSEAETEFGETPLARPFAFVQYHWRQLQIKDPANPGEIYAMAVFLDQRRFFLNKHPDRRNALGLHRHALQRELRAQKARREAAERQRRRQPATGH